MAPASVTKLFTAAAVLEALEPSNRLRTSVLAAAAPVDGVVAGDLWLVGGGDPVLGTDAWAAQLRGQTLLYTSLDALADRVVAAGVAVSKAESSATKVATTPTVTSTPGPTG